ncbi:protein 5NUC isoform X4 [Plutella xylostella]|uniref:protein 5NUC isoform X4 n=1 Tax=Plutella xylostella TaxID=51655 RepID=UPI00203261D5|nr:protein 5NUC isoform X4 [Plutella xylostella]
MALLLTILSLTTLVTSSVVHPSPGDSFELLILHNNDMHARFEQTSQLSGICTPADRQAGRCYGGFPRVAHVVKEARRAAASGEGPPVLYLNAGDTYTGTAWFTIYKWRIAAEFLNALQPDAVSLGNHEFDERVGGLVPFLRNVTTPVLAANLVLDRVPELLHEPNLKKSIVLTVKDTKIGIIGYLTPETKILAPNNDVEYEDEVVALKREVKVLQEQGVKILIALGHSGFLEDMEIAKEVEGLDLVIGGHSNTFLWNGETSEQPEQVEGPYPTMVQQASGKMVPVVQAYAYTKYMGKLHLIFDAEGEIAHFDGNPIVLSQDVPRDPEVLDLVLRYHEDIERTNSEVVGTSMNALDGLSCRIKQCNIGNLITDSIVHYSKDQGMCTNIAIVQGGRIRASIRHEQGPIDLTKGDWFTVLPFSDTLTVVTMNGSTLLRALEHSVDTWRTVDSTGQFLQFSGMQVIYDLAKPPGSRVVSAKAVESRNTCEVSELQDIKESGEYKVIMPTFLAEGGDGYANFVGQPREMLSYNELTAVFDYLRKNSPVNPLITDRLIVRNVDRIQKTARKGKHLPSSAHTLSIYYEVIFIFNSFLILSLW